MYRQSARQQSLCMCLMEAETWCGRGSQRWEGIWWHVKPLTCVHMLMCKCIYASVSGDVYLRVMQLKNVPAA